MKQFVWLIVAFVAIQFVVVALSIRKRFKSVFAAMPPGMDLAKLREFTSELERTIEERVRSRWSGDTAALPPVLTALIAELEAATQARGLPIERALLRRLVLRTIEMKQLVGAAELREAAKQVA